MTPKQMHKLLIGVLVLLILATIGGLYIANHRLTNLTKQTSRLSAEIEVSKKQIDIYELTKFKVDSLGYVDELASKVLPQDEEQSVVVAELSQFARRASLQVSGIEFVEAPQKSDKDKKKSVVPKSVTAIPITVTFKAAKYEGLLEFLRSVEGNRRKMQVNNIGLKQNEDDGSLLDVSVSMNLYAKKPAAAAEKKQ